MKHRNNTLEISEDLEYYNRKINRRKWWFSVERRECNNPYRCQGGLCDEPWNKDAHIQVYAKTPEEAARKAEVEAGSINL